MTWCGCVKTGRWWRHPSGQHDFAEVSCLGWSPSRALVKLLFQEPRGVRVNHLSVALLFSLTCSVISHLAMRAPPSTGVNSSLFPKEQQNERICDRISCIWTPLAFRTSFCLDHSKFLGSQMLGWWRMECLRLGSWFSGRGSLSLLSVKVNRML